MLIRQFFIQRLVPVLFLIFNSNFVHAGSQYPKVALHSYQKFSCENVFPEESQGRRFQVLPLAERPLGTPWLQTPLRLRRQLAYQKHAAEKIKPEAEALDLESSLRAMKDRAKYLFYSWAVTLENQKNPYHMNAIEEEFWKRYFNSAEHPSLARESDSEDDQIYYDSVFAASQKDLMSTIYDFIEKQFPFTIADIDHFTSLAFVSLMQVGAGLLEPESMEQFERLVLVSAEFQKNGHSEINTYLRMSEDHLQVQRYSEKVILSYLIMSATADARMMLKLEALNNEFEDPSYPENSLAYLDMYLLRQLHYWMLGQVNHTPLQNTESFNRAFLSSVDKIEKTLFQDDSFYRKYGIRSWDDYLRLHMIHPKDLEAPPRLSKAKPKKKDTIH